MSEHFLDYMNQGIREFVKMEGKKPRVIRLNPKDYETLLKYNLPYISNEGISYVLGMKIEINKDIPEGEALLYNPEDKFEFRKII